MDINALSREELVALIQEQDIDTLMRCRANKLSNLGYVEPEEEPADYEEDDNEFDRIQQLREARLALPKVLQEKLKRWEDLEALRAHYALFEDFLHDCMTELLGFNCTELQVDIGNFLSSDVQYGMIQAQRSQAKSTIVAIFAVWVLIHNTRARVLIVSAGSDVATEIANWVIQIIMNWDILECMRPDRQHGDRASSKAFDVHWQLKGAEKSPSIACIGITANMQGRRADLLIADDIESSKNGLTETQRASLEYLSRDFSSICQHGRIIYLGTPQTTDSIYRRLPERGFTVRVWPGRYPTEKEEAFYEGTLAPYIVKQLEIDPTLRTGGGVDGTRGKPTDPELLDEKLLQAKELNQGPAFFNLQHMLNTSLSDEDRYPLKTKNLVIMNFPMDQGPGKVVWLPDEAQRLDNSNWTCRPKLYKPWSVSKEMYDYEGKYMYVDTAGGGSNGDEIVAVVSYLLHGYVFIPEMVALPGGHDEKNYEILSQLALKHLVNDIDVEKNFGYGSFSATWRPILMKTYKESGRDYCPVIGDYWESGQKELRIADGLEPLMARHRLIIHEDVLDYDISSVLKYPYEKRENYKLLHQMSKLTRQRGALIHDDRLDALHGACRKWTERLAVDEDNQMDAKKTDENVDFFRQWGADIGNKPENTRIQDRFKSITNRRLH